MKKTLALALAAALLYLTPSVPVSINSLAASTKFYTAANPIPNRYIVVLATTDLSPVAAPAPTPVAAAPKTAKTSSTSATSFESSSMMDVEEAPAADPVEETATELTATYGGSFSTTWSVAIKGFLLNSTEAQAIAMSGDSKVALIVEDGAIAVGSPDSDPIQMSPDPGAGLNPQPNASW